MNVALSYLMLHSILSDKNYPARDLPMLIGDEGVDWYDYCPLAARKLDECKDILQN